MLSVQGCNVKNVFLFCKVKLINYTNYATLLRKTAELIQPKNMFSSCEPFSLIRNMNITKVLPSNLWTLVSKIRKQKTKNPSAEALKENVVPCIELMNHSFKSGFIRDTIGAKLIYKVPSYEQHVPIDLNHFPIVIG